MEKKSYENVQKRRAVHKTVEANNLMRFNDKPKLTELVPNVFPKVLNLLGISNREDVANIRILDSYSGKILVHFLIPIASTRHIRGIIIDVTGEPKIVCNSFPHIHDCELDSKEFEDFEFVPSVTQVSEAKEGTILRLFFDDGEQLWTLSTHKRINGWHSKWYGSSFGELFSSLWGDKDMNQLLRRDRCYIFSFSDKKNRIVCSIERSSLTLIGVSERMSNGRMKDIYPFSSIEHPLVSMTSYLPFKTKEELKAAISKLDWQQTTGFVLSNANYSLKVLAPHYSQMREIRGNEPNLTLRYLQLKSESRVEELKKLYPENDYLFNKIESQLVQLPKYLAKNYRLRFIENQRLHLPKEEFSLLMKVKEEYDANLSVEDNVQSQFMKCRPRQLNALIRNLPSSREYRYEDNIFSSRNYRDY